ncbi:elongator complex protein 4 isoform X2 [Zootermopsis nevadensis]|uniref:elongator complex protein 4 isoform X2 n=1 Tax=Zootermopsis nevadensis TaxID=136037 RepID=UPI000B8E7F9E|nr:elongator complex protein 4 isoform X2 [Zootermopsis nevadensis]XP_021912803.1 elongator complex protein 4 isoform X2 [Zootermopsis nevadensis]
MEGGGIPVGTVVLIEEDKYGTYAKLLLKYFLAEGIVSGHSLIVASQDSDCENLVRELPAPVQLDDSVRTSDSDDKMTIAWRYQNMRVVQSSPTSTSFGHNYDLTKSLDAEILKAADVCYWTGCTGYGQSESRFTNPAYYDLLCTIHNKIEEGQFGVAASPEKRNILRTAVHSVGSPLWTEETHVSSYQQKSDLALFFYCLRSLIRSAYAVCVLTLPSHLFQETSIIKRLEHLCDASVRLESFAGSEKETNPVYKDYHGLFHINQLPAINTLMSHVPESFDLAFKLRRKRFLIEKLHLPPELQETTQREQDDLPSLASGICGVQTRSILDF